MSFHKSSCRTLEEAQAFFLKPLNADTTPVGTLKPLAAEAYAGKRPTGEPPAPTGGHSPGSVSTISQESYARIKREAPEILNLFSTGNVLNESKAAAKHRGIDSFNKMIAEHYYGEGAITRTPSAMEQRIREKEIYEEAEAEKLKQSIRESEAAGRPWFLQSLDKWSGGSGHAKSTAAAAEMFGKIKAKGLLQ